ncbi:hypothetical protein AHMF7605_20830 [Adhaeribacter arboris]|uniref:Uncharacterized protein n=1 Tax=Adhaeribacter arboris TaxID=2072846 RepID=A0A2T2YJT0_9BACT|nr:DUF3883 domain-containing protein [Adhaeribacter arboris]PSR55773.1 hypothetical protein AHMF7605_20830 [Adhaeribacter arboris]
MNIQKKLKDLKDQKSYSNPAKRVMEHLKPILSKSNDLRQRWVWELLQNASDLGDNVKARFEITADRLKFSHNGKAFSLDEAYNLIMPDSSKDDAITHKKSVIGQFGTGFISTHILSKIIQIEGIIEDDEQFYTFNFHLDRSERNNKDFLIQSIKDAEAEYRENLEEIEELPENEFQTSFTYHINNTYSSLKGQEIVEDGIKNFKELIPYVLTFRPQLAEVEVIDRRTTTTKWTFKRDEVETDIDDLVIIKTICYKNSKHIEDRLIGNIIQKGTEIAFPIEEIEDGKFQLLPFPNNCPLLFCAFPMIGTSHFDFPVVIHSEKFDPNEARDGIEISQHDLENRNRLIEAKDAFLRLLKIIEGYEWTNTFNISLLFSPDFNDYSVKTWFTNLIFKPIKEGLHKTKMIELDESLIKNKRLSLSQVYIPYTDRRLKNYTEQVTDIYNFAFKTIPTLLPKKDHFLSWYEVLDFEIFTDEKLDLEELTKKISEEVDSLDKFCSEYSMDETAAIEFLIDFIRFILAQEKDELFDKYKLILNQSNQLCYLKGMKLDLIDCKGLKDGYDEKLKDIYYSISDTECRDILLHKDFEQIDGLIEENDKYEFEKLAKDTDEELRNYEGNFQDENFLLILKNLFNWYTTCGLSEETLTNLFRFFSSNKSQLYLNTKTSEELEYAFDIEISGKSEVLAKLANSSLLENELETIADNPVLISNFIEWLNNKQEDHPEEELGNIGEEFLYHRLCQIFGENRVLWEDKSEYDFRVLEMDLTTTKYFIDAKTTGKGIANSDNVPFFMRTAQWSFLDKQQARNKYIIARIFKTGRTIDIKYLRLNKQSLQ